MSTNFVSGSGIEIFLLWAALLLVLLMAILAPVSPRLRMFGLIGLVITIWLLWPLYAVEYLADTKWPHPQSQLKKSGAEKESADTRTGTQGENENSSNEEPTARLGQVGDLFGGINALFAALAFAGVGIAAFQQWKSTQLAFKQSIEATFFSALELHHKIADSLQFDLAQIFPEKYKVLDRLAVLADGKRPQRPPPVHGRRVFGEVIKSLSYSGDRIAAYEYLMAQYSIIQNEHNYVLGHYFRNLYQILKLIDTDDALDANGKQKYASMLRAQLSSDELALLMVNCAGTIVDKGEFRALLVRYRMLEHAPLKKVGDEYLHSGKTEQVVLADALSIKQYLSEPSLSNERRRYKGAFGSNPAV